MIKLIKFGQPDITYIHMRYPSLLGSYHGLAHSRYLLSWHLSKTLDTSFDLKVLDEPFKKYGHYEIFNSDQGM